MMKKLSKLVLLAAATALLLAGVTACSDDDDKDPEPDVKIEGSTSVAVDDEITLTANATGFLGDVTYTWRSLDTATATVTQNTSVPSKATVKGIAEGTAKITVTAKAGDTEKTAEVTVKVATGGEQPSTLWKISDYFSELGNVPNGGSAASLSSLGHTDGKDCGIVKIGANVKVRSDGDGKSNTITEGITGYCQLSNGKAGSLLLTVPAGATKITLGAKNANRALAIYDETYGTLLKEFKDDIGDYADYVYEYAFTAETQIYITSPSGTTNFKAIKVE